MRISIKLSDGSVLERIFEAPTVTVGRSSKSDFVIIDDILSRQHCQIDLHEGTFYVTDLNSGNGVYLDGKRLTPGVKTALLGFNSFQIANLDCEVKDSEVTKSTQYIAGIKAGVLPDFVAAPTAATRKINKGALTQPPVVKVQKKPDYSARNFKIMLILSTLLIIGAGIYYKSKPDEVISGPNAEVYKTEIPDKFLTDAEYKERESFRGCQNDTLTVCKDFELDDAQNEGFAEDKKEFILFVNPTTIPEISFPTITDQLQKTKYHTTLQLLRSALFAELISKKIDQIHIVIAGIGAEPPSIIRLHTQHFVKDGLYRETLKKLLIESVNSGGWFQFESKATPHFFFQN